VDIDSMIKYVTLNNFRGLKELTIPLSQFTLLTGTNCVGKTSALEGLYCLFSQTKLDIAALSRYNRTLRANVKQNINGNLGFAPRYTYNYRLYWEECPTFGEDTCSISAEADNRTSWKWTYKKVGFADLGKLSEMIPGSIPLPVDSSSEFALWHWEIQNPQIDRGTRNASTIYNHIERAQLLAPDGGLYLLPAQITANSSICIYLDFPGIRAIPQRLTLQTSKRLTEALKIINLNVTDVRLTDIEGGLSAVLDNTHAVTLGSLGNGAVTWASVLITLFTLMESVKFSEHQEIPIIILIDEIGAGVHYSVMCDMWKYLYSLAKQHPQLQFITTSHNYDCVRALCEVFVNIDSAKIVRLHNIIGENKINSVKITTYDHKQFGKVLSDEWEVRG
jgi:energy-coupling factor transporter ATP-binding protein EcfA2